MNAFGSIVIVDVDAGVDLKERQDYAAAQTAQFTEDFGPRWGSVHGVRAGTPDAPPQPGEIQLQLLKEPTEDGALGFHDTLVDGTPIAYVFVGLAKSLGETWTTVASHEALELAADPLLRRAVMMADGFWDQEVCDRVEQDSYRKGGVLLSNFNTPECFEPPVLLTGVKFDQLGLSTKPNEVRPGGYAQRFDANKGWVQVGQMSAYRTKLSALGLSRGAKRRAVVQSTFWSRVFRR